MAGEEYIRVAASNLQRAAVAKQNEANEIRVQIGRLEEERHKKVQDIESEVNRNNAISSNPNVDDERRALAARQSIKLESDRSNLENDIAHRRSQLEQKLREIEDQARDWQDKVSELTNL